MASDCGDIDIAIDKTKPLLQDVKLGVACACFEPSLEEFESAYHDKFSKLVKRVEELLKSRYSLEELKAHPIVKAFRNYYWRTGIDPTKTRPAGEALARRILQGRPFNSINPIVDAGNLASAESFIPIGIYDLGSLGKKLVLTLSKGGEVFTPIGGRERTLEKGIPILIDDNDTVIHVFPHRDSIKTSVKESTRCVLIIVAGVPGISKDDIMKTIDKIRFYAEELGLRTTAWKGPWLVQ